MNLTTQGRDGLLEYLEGRRLPEVKSGDTKVCGGLAAGRARRGEAHTRASHGWTAATRASTATNADITDTASGDADPTVVTGMSGWAYPIDQHQITPGIDRNWHGPTTRSPPHSPPAVGPQST